MKICNRYLVTGLLALALSSSASAHDPAHDGGYPGSAWSGSATVWGPSSGYSGWSGTLSLGAFVGYPTGLVAVAPPPSGHRHLASCRHAPPRYYAYAKGKHYGQGRGHAKRRLERHHGHH